MEYYSNYEQFRNVSRENNKILSFINTKQYVCINVFIQAYINTHGPRIHQSMRQIIHTAFKTGYSYGIYKNTLIIYSNKLNINLRYSFVKFFLSSEKRVSSVNIFKHHLLKGHHIYLKQ